ncbi:hypothetical protein JTE90_008926 [Oedothorax gibbosus]|uniref:Serine/threonine-protein kinase ATM n=1 Tax=Oedothorax gibbosus TaxID=931172 RepID=A0AAV6UMI2_9ARAC|nr:hypothetical protein JTE90_008926 [Oedothorax gibbosus]
MNEYEIGRKLRDCLLQLVEGKVTEQKKQVDDLILYLTQAPYIRHLNSNSIKKKNPSHSQGAPTITWKIVFRRIKDFINQESQKFKIRETSDKVLSATVRTNIMKEKRKCSGLFRCYVKAIKSNQQFEMAESVVDHILAVLNDSYTRTSYGSVYSLVLSKYILSDVFMYIKVPPPVIDDAIWLYCKIIKNPPPDLDRSILTQVLLQLLTVRSNLGGWDASKLVDFFISIFDAIKTEKVSSHHENLLKSLLLVCQTLGVDYRLRLCQLGESILLPLLQLWKTRPSEICQELMLEFMSFQLAIHHPVGTVEEDKGARAYDWTLWKSQLLSLYKIVVVEIDELCEKNKYSSSKENILKPSFISVAVEVCAQVFVDGVSVLDITQMPSTYDGNISSKKRRIEVCFRTLTDSLSSAKIVPWLQVISDFIVKYPDIVSVDEAEYLLESLIKLNLSCNQFETKNWLLICFQSFVEAFGMKDNLNNIPTNFNWQRLWDLAVKSVALMHQCQEAGHKLLGTLLSYKLIIPKIEFYNLYGQGSSNHVTSASLQTLRIFLEKYPIPSIIDVFRQNNLHSNNVLTFENQVLDWLFARNSEESFRTLPIDGEISIIEELSSVLVLLCLKNCELRRQHRFQPCTSEKLKWISEMEKELLNTTFDMQTIRTHSEIEIISSMSKGVLCSEMWEKILNFFIDISSNIFQESHNNPQVSMAPIFVGHAMLFFEILHLFYVQGVFKDADLGSNHFISYLGKFLNCALEVKKNNENVEGSTVQVVLLFKDFLAHVASKFKNFNQTSSDRYFIASVSNAIPSEVLKCILQFSLEIINEPHGSISNVSKSSGEQPVYPSTPIRNRYDDFDEDFDEEPDPFESKMEVEDSLDSMESKSSNENFQHQMQCLGVLGDYCSIVASVHKNQKPDFIPNILIDNLVSILASKSHSLKSRDDINLVFVSLKCILINKFLKDQVVEGVINTLKHLLNQLSASKEMSLSVIELFSLLFPHVIKSDLEGPTNMSQNKSHMLHLLKILSKKECEKKGSAMTSYSIAKNLLTLLKMEPSLTWNPLSHKLNENGHNSNGVNEEPVISTLSQFLQSPYISVRLFVSANIHTVISDYNIEEVFDAACSENIQFLLKPKDQLYYDESGNVISSFFHLMSNTILHFPCLQKEALFAVFKTMMSKQADSVLTVKVLDHISNCLGYESTKHFVEQHLIYILHKWIDEKFDLEEFPYSVLDKNSFGSFLSEYHRSIIPVIFFKEDIPSISVIAQKLELTNTEMLVACLPTLQARILSYCAIESKKEHSAKFKSLLNSIVSHEITEKVFLSKLDDFVISLLSMLKNTQGSHLKFCQRNDVCTITSKELFLTISHIMTNMEHKGSFISFLHQKADNIQNILLSLNIKLSKAKTPHEEADVLLMYHTFLELLCTELGPTLNCSCFVIKEIIYTIIQFLTNKEMKEKLLIDYCCDILQLLCSKAVVHFKEIIGDFLPFIVSSLTPFVSETLSGQKVLSLLSFLIIENQENLAEYISTLDPFPQTKNYQNLYRAYNHVKYRIGILSLEQEIGLFLKSSKMMNKATIEGLKHLCSQLNSRKPELLEILNLLKGKILFSEEVKASVLHQLICQLASICAQENVPSEVQKAASNCLGAIGPVALSSVVLQPSTTSYKNISPLNESYAVILNLLAEYLFDKRTDIKLAASSIMKELFGIKSAYSFFTDYQIKKPDNSLLRYAFPFFACQNVKGLKKSSQFNCNIECLQELSLWVPETCSHSEWVTNLVCIIIESDLIKNDFYNCLVPICKTEVSFCEKILPYLIHGILQLDNEITKKAISNGIHSFFSAFSSWMQCTPNKTGLSPNPLNVTQFSKLSVQTMLSVLHHIWLNPRSSKARNILKDLWLDIGFLEVAQAAQYCSAYFTAILYTELWCDKMREDARQSDHFNDHSESSGSLDCSPLSYVGSRSRGQASLVYEILVDTYTQIGDSDAISGCEVVATDSQAILKHSYLTDKKWDGLLKISDLNNSKVEILQALQKNHLNSVLQGYIQSQMHNQDEASKRSMLEYQCETAWRMSQWDLVTIDNTTQGFQELLYKSQQNLISGNNIIFEKHIDDARKTQFEYVRHTSLEAARNILPVLSNIQMLSVLEDFHTIQTNPDCLNEVLKSWNLQEQMPFEDFSFVEPVSWLKCVLLKQLVDANAAKHWQARTTVITELKKLLERHAFKARKELHLEVATNAIHMLRKIPCTEEEDILRWQMEEAKTLWTKKECSIANRILKSSLPFMEKFAKENPEFLLHYGQALTLRGRWLAETCNENSAVIMRDYLEKALDVLKNTKTNEKEDWTASVCDAYLAVARYADGQYQSIINYKKSTAYQTKQVVMSTSKEKAKQLKTKDISDDQKRLLVILTRQTDIDQNEMKGMEVDRKRFLQNAIENYMECLKGSDAHDLWIFRLVSLWFQNLNDEEMNRIIKDKIHRLQSYKFLPLMYQLAARMGTQASNTFTSILLSLLKQLSLEHPHHALPVILALNNADKDPVDDTKQPSDQTAHLTQAEVPAVKERMNAAKKLLSSLQKTKITKFVQCYSDLCDAYISLAYLKVQKTVKRGVIPKEQPLLKFRNLLNIPIITEDIKVDRSCEYKNIIGIHSFHKEFRMCGGITLPKVIKCVGTDGIEREQLVKGCDDLRQDAVMQQVFNLVNCLLQEKMETRQRKLHIRTYKVVPVSRRSGVLQWCEGTQVLSQYLVGSLPSSPGAHIRYYPDMATPQHCRTRMMNISAEPQLPKKRQIYDNICTDFPPVFRYFFLENFPEPSAWFERRQSYTKSVAASSIVGYILGLGDRHVNNILIDKYTAEVVHIDFGIAFEKGRILATPETVPFRLTRDIVDGMGINGVEGTFKRCSEKTLEVMRNSQDVLLTILEVLLHDPLYEWAVPACKSATKSSSASNSQNGNEVNTLAERALMRLQQKLQGLEEGVAMSTEGQVNLLIQQARDPNNLCRIYAGWQPYL